MTLYFLAWDSIPKFTEKFLQPYILRHSFHRVINWPLPPPPKNNDHFFFFFGGGGGKTFWLKIFSFCFFRPNVFLAKLWRKWDPLTTFRPMFGQFGQEIESWNSKNRDFFCFFTIFQCFWPSVKSVQDVKNSSSENFFNVVRIPNVPKTFLGSVETL